jgi:hypothetical protein
VEASEIEVVPFIATDNLVARSRTKWALPALDTIARLLVGKPFELNHDWDDVGAIVGVVFDAKVLHLSSVPAPYLLQKKSSDVFQSEGYHPVIAEVAFPRTSTLLSGLQLGAVPNVSIGYFTTTDLICPWCETSFNNYDDCPHIPPSPWWRDCSTTAPYAIRADTTDMGELSSVVIPDVIGAQMIKTEYASLYGY